MSYQRWILVVLRMTIALLLLGATPSAWAQDAAQEKRILERAAELHAMNPIFRVTLKEAGPFEFGERIFVDSNLEEISKRLYPATHENDPWEVRFERENELRFAYAGALLEGPFSCGDFKAPCAYESYQRRRLMGQPETATERLSPINANLPPLKPGKYRLVLLVKLRDQLLLSAMERSRLLGETAPGIPVEESYLVSNVLEFEVRPLNQQWVNSRLGALSAMPPLPGWKSENRGRVGEKAMLSTHMPLAEMLFLPTEATLATAFEYYVETGFQPILATFYYHPDSGLACRFLMAQIATPGFPLLPKILEQTPHICVDSEHHYQQYLDAGARNGQKAYYTALRQRYDDYDRFRLQIARIAAARFREDPENEAALKGFLEATRNLYNRALAEEQLKTELVALRSELKPRLRSFSLPLQANLIRRRDVVPEEIATAMALQVLEESWPESVCVDGKLRLEEDYNSWINLRRVALQLTLRADPERAKAVTETMLERLDPTLDSDLASSLPFTVAVPDAMFEAASAGKLGTGHCGKVLTADVVKRLHFLGKPVDELVTTALSGTWNEQLPALSALAAKDPQRYAEVLIERVRHGAEQITGEIAEFLSSERICRNVTPATFQELGLALLARPDLNSQREGARALRRSWKDHKELLIERYKLIDRSLLSSQVSESQLEYAEATFRDAISRGLGWMTTKEELFELDRYCDFEMCKRGLAIDMQYLQPAVSMSIHPPDNYAAYTRITFAQYHDQETGLYDNEETLRLIRRYPRNTPIRITRWTSRGPQQTLEIDMTWLARLKAEGFSDVEVIVEPN